MWPLPAVVSYSFEWKIKLRSRSTGGGLVTTDYSFALAQTLLGVSVNFLKKVTSVLLHSQKKNATHSCSNILWAFKQWSCFLFFLFITEY